MTAQEVLIVIGTLSGAYIVGFAAGFVILAIKQFLEKI